MAYVALGVLYRSDNGILIVRFHFRTLINDDNLCTVASHGTHRKALYLGSVFQCTYAFVARKLHWSMTITLDLTHDLRVADEVVLYFLDDQRRLLRCSRHYGDQAARIEYANSKATQRRQPRLAITTALNHHERIRVAKLTRNNLLRILELNTKIVLDKYILMRAPEMDLHGPQLYIADIPNLRDRHITTCSSPTAATVCLKSSTILSISSGGKLTGGMSNSPLISIFVTIAPKEPKPAISPGLRLHAAKFALLLRLSKIACDFSHSATLDYPCRIRLYLMSASNDAFAALRA